MEIGISIRTLRKTKGLTQQELADLAGISRKSVYETESGKQNPTTDLLRAMSKAINIPLPVMLWFSVDENDVPKGRLEFFKLVKPTIDKLLDEAFGIDNKLTPKNKKHDTKSKR